MPAPPMVIAHRGIHTTGQIENTVGAFQAAVDAGAEMIEFDVRRTGAGELAILHDHKLKGVALDAVSLDEFERKTGFRPPLLAEVLTWADGRIGLDVELKEDGYVEALAPLLEQFQADGGQLIVTSFNENVLRQLAQLAPSIQTGLLLSFTAEKAAQRTAGADAAIALPDMKIVSELLIEEIRGAELDLIVWDYMAARHGPKLLSDPRVRAVITDDVAGALSTRAERAACTLSADECSPSDRSCRGC